MGRIETTLMALADTVRSFRQDADLEVCLDKRTIYMPGITEERAHQLVSGVCTVVQRLLNQVPINNIISLEDC